MIGALELSTTKGLSFESADGKVCLAFDFVEAGGLQVQLDGSWLTLSPQEAHALKKWLKKYV